MLNQYFGSYKKVNDREIMLSSAYDKELSERLKGEILLQVESQGEAWYLNPTDNKRYYLGRPADAFGIMRELSIGISNEDFIKL